MEIKEVLGRANEIVKLARKMGWSEEELAKAIRLLHSEFEELRRSIEFT